MLLNAFQGQEYTDQYKLEYQREDGGTWFRFRNRRQQEVGNFVAILKFTPLFPLFFAFSSTMFFFFHFSVQLCYFHLTHILFSVIFLATLSEEMT